MSVIRSRWRSNPMSFRHKWTSVLPDTVIINSTVRKRCFARSQPSGSADLDVASCRAGWPSSAPLAGSSGSTAVPDLPHNPKIPARSHGRPGMILWAFWNDLGALAYLFAPVASAIPAAALGEFPGVGGRNPVHEQRLSLSRRARTQYDDKPRCTFAVVSPMAPNAQPDGFCGAGRRMERPCGPAAASTHSFHV